MRIAKRSFLPTTTLSVHASTIAFWKDHPVFAWFGGTREADSDVAIYINNIHDDGKTIVIGNKDYLPRWNPILFPYNNKLFLFEKIGEFCDRWASCIHEISSWKHDITEKEVRETMQILPAGLNGPVKTKPIEHNGLVYCGSSCENILDWSSSIEAYFLDYGKWQLISRSKPIVVSQKVPYREPMTGRTLLSKGVIQPSLWIDEGDSWSDHGGKIQCLMRSCGLNKVYYSEHSYNIEDGWIGKSEAIPTNLPNPNSSIDTVFYNGFLYIACNPQDNSRSPLVLLKVDRLEEHDGIMKLNIVDRLVIQDKVEQPNMNFCSKELSYPYMVQKDGEIHCVYTYGRALIEYTVISDL